MFHSYLYSSVIVFQTYNVILTKILTLLYLYKRHLFIFSVGYTVSRLLRYIYCFSFIKKNILAIKGYYGLSLNYHPVFLSPEVLLIAQSFPGQHGYSLYIIIGFIQ